jgi:hypothetical protein
MSFDIVASTSASEVAPRNSDLNRAGTSRRDEFYTQYEDIEAELSNYPGLFEGSRILCNCDDLLESQFVRFFVLNFEKLGLKEVVATSYAASGFLARDEAAGVRRKAQKAVIKSVDLEKVLRRNGSIDWELVFKESGNEISFLKGDGDFRSAECVELLDAASVVVTNPPFSLFREYINQLVSREKDFIILGNMNAVTYKEVFPLFQANKVWFGVSIKSGDRKFNVPDEYPLDAAGCGIDTNGKRFIRVKGVRWFTNIDHNRRHLGPILRSRFSSSSYQQFENYNAINVPKVSEIPYDYEGIMGVPITFLDKYNPDEFEILMLANGNARTNVPREILRVVGYEPSHLDRGGVGVIDGKRSYARILIRKSMK